MINLKRAKYLWEEFQKIRERIDDINTPNLSKIKEIFKRIHFSDIETEEHIHDNKGSVYYKQYPTSDTKIIGNINLSYTIEPKKTGLAYGFVTEKKDKDGNKTTSFTYDHFDSYARFIADVVSHKIIYSKELECFVEVDVNSYTPITEIYFMMMYPTNPKQSIADFLLVMQELYQEQMPEPLHGYVIQPVCLAGNDWIYDCNQLQLVKRVPEGNELFFAHYEVELSEINLITPNNFLNKIADTEASLHNLKLVHAYVMQRKLKLVPAEQWFLLKDFGRTGKGLYIESFKAIFKYRQISFDSLKKSGSFEAQNEWANLHGAELAHANEAGEINEEGMRVLRKIATSEVVTGRLIGQNAIRFKNEAVLILDTNEAVEIGSIAANVSRTVKIAFKDRPNGETKEQRHAFFKPYWDFIQPDGENSTAASLSFLLNSLNYLSESNGIFTFKDVTLKNYASADDFTETQRILIEGIAKNGFIFSNDETLQKAIENDYGSLRYKIAKSDIKAIGVALNKSKKIDGNVFKVNTIGNKGFFEQSLTLIQDESDAY